MAAQTAQINIRQTYGELAKAEKSGDFERALKACNRILKATPQDAVAFQCKLVCLLQLSKFDEALQLVRKASNLQDFAFEKAYCEYRLNRTEEAIKTLRAVSSDITELDFRCQELMAQLLYRAEQLEECYEIYKNLLKNSQDDFDETRRANLAAVAAQLTAKNPELSLDTGVSQDSFEQCFNEGCRLAAAGNFKKAKSMLERAEAVCRRSLTEDEATEDEIEEELAGIRVQLAYCLQMMDDNERAAKIYNDVIKQKPSDLALLAVASNNLVSVRKEQNLFDARKKLKNCTASQVEQKLNRYQKSVVCLNNALVLLHSNQLEPCRRAIDDLRQRFPSSMETAVLCEAALLARQKDTAGAVDVLKKYIGSTSGIEDKKPQSLVVDFALAQMYLLDGQRNRAVEYLQSLGDDIRYQPGVVGLLVALNLSDDDNGRSALDVLAKGVDWYKRRKNAADDPQLPVMIEECASLYARFGDQTTATTYLEDLRRMKPDDPAILSRLMNAYVQFDPKKAEEVSKALPPLGRLTHNVDVDSLLNAGWLMLGSKYGAKKATRTATTPQPGSDDAGLVKKRTNKKKKKRLPKNYDPNGPPPDPERWLPKYERAAFKKKKDKRQKERDIGRGTQGAVGGGTELDSGTAAHAASPPPARPAPSATAAQPGPRQLRPGVQKQKPKKKGKGGNW